MCDYCGIFWYQSALAQDASGYWACPDDQSGRDTVTLNRENSQERITDGIPSVGAVRVIT